MDKDELIRKAVKRQTSDDPDDVAFRKRLAEAMERNQEILDRLAET